MSYVFWDNENRITLIHNAPEKLSEEVKEQGLEVNSDDIPEKENRYGQRAVRYIDPDTGDMWVEYEDRPLTPEEKTQQYISKLAQISTSGLVKEEKLTEDELIDLAEMYPRWKLDTEYKAGQIISYHNKLYEVLQDHTSQEDWSPDVAESLFTNVMPEGVIPEWEQPSGSHDAYNEGDKVTHNGEVWISMIDANTWEPGVEGWEIYEEE